MHCSILVHAFMIYLVNQLTVPDMQRVLELNPSVGRDCVVNSWRPIGIETRF